MSYFERQDLEEIEATIMDDLNNQQMMFDEENYQEVDNGFI